MALLSQVDNVSLLLKTNLQLSVQILLDKIISYNISMTNDSCHLTDKQIYKIAIFPQHCLHQRGSTKLLTKLVYKCNMVHCTFGRV